MKLKCTWCGAEFDEEDMDEDFMSDEKYCPECGAYDCEEEIKEDN